MIEPKTGYRYVGGEKDGEEYDYDKDKSIIIYNEEEGRYYLVTTKVVIIEEELPDTIESEGAIVKVYYRDGKYYVSHISGMDVDLTTTSYSNQKTVLEVIGDITAVNSLTIRALDKGDILIKGAISANGSTLSINAGSNNVEIIGNGQIIGNTSNTNVNISAGSVRTSRSHANRFDVSGRLINITASYGVGSQENPIAVQTGAGGLKISAGNGSNVYLQNDLAPLYIVSIETNGSVFITSDKPVYTAAEQSAVNISGSNLELIVKDGSIGQSDKMLIISITGQITARASGDIYLKQKSSAVLVKDLSSKEGSVEFVSDKDVIVVKIEANGTVIIETIDGSIFNGVDSGYAVKGKNVILESGNTIGTSSKPFTVYVDNGVLTVVSKKDAYISQLGGDITVDHMESKEGSIVFYANGEIAIEVIKAREGVTVSSEKGIHNVLNDDGINIYGRSIVITAGNSIGSNSKPLVVFLTGGILRADTIGDILIVNRGNEDITVEHMKSEDGDISFETNSKASIDSMTGKNITVIGEKDIYLKSIVAENKVYIHSKSGLGIFGLDNQEGTGHIQAAEIVLLSAGSIGRDSKYLLTELKENGTVKASAEYDIFIKNLSATGITVEEIISNSGGIAFVSNADTLVKFMNAAKDIMLTVNSGDLRIVRIAAGQRAEVNVLNGSIINEGLTGANIEAAEIVLKIARAVGANDKYIYTDITQDGSIAIIASDDVFVEELQGDMRISKVHTKGDVYLIAQGSILNVDASDTNVIGRNLTLKSLTGTIGLSDALLTIKTSEGGHMRANTKNKGIYIRSVAGDLIIDWINAGNAPVVLKAVGSVIDGLEEDNLPNITASALSIKTETGNIGAAPLGGKDRSIRLELSNSSRLDIDAGGSVYLRELTGNLGLGIIIVRGDQLVLTVPGNIFTTLTKEDMLAGRANITAKEVILTSLNGTIGEDTNPNQTYFDEDYAGWITTSSREGYELSAKAEGDIYIREISNSLIVGVIESISGNVSLSAYMDVKSYNEVGSDRVNVTGNDIYVETTNGIISLNVTANGDVVFNSSGSITNIRQERIKEISIVGNNITLISKYGSVGQKESYIEIDTADTGILNVYAYLGIYIRELKGNLTIGSIISITGDIEIEVVDGDILGITLNEDSDGMAEYSDNGSGKPAHIAGKNIKLVSLAGGIGKKDNYIAVDSDGRIVLLGKADIYVEESAGDMILELVKTDGNIHLLSDGSIVAAEDAEGIVVIGEDITLTAVEGGIGTAEKAVAIDLGKSGVLKAYAAKSIYLDAAAGDMRIYQVQTPESIWLRALGSIVNGAPEGTINISGKDVVLTAVEGYAGTGNRAIVVNTDLITAEAAMDITLYGIGSIGLRRIISHNGNVHLTAEMNIVPAMNSDEPIIKANNIVIRAEMGSVGLSDKFLTIDASDKGYVYGYAGDNLYLYEMNGDLRVDEITAGNNMVLKADGSIVNVSDNGINAKAKVLTLIVGNRIGDKDKLFIVETNELTATSMGDIYIGSAEDLNIVSVLASDGNIHLVSDKSVKGLLTERVPVIIGIDLFIQAGGGIGTKNNPIRIDLLDGSNISLYAVGNIYLEELTGSINIIQVSTQGDIEITVDKDILAVTDNEVSIKARNINLISVNGSIGTIDRAVTIELIQSGSLSAMAPLSIYISAPTGDLRISEIITPQDAVLSARISVIALGGMVNITAKDVNITAIGGDVGSSDHKLVVSTDVINVNAKGSIYIYAIGSIGLRELISQTGSVTLEAEGDILSATTGSSLNLAGNTIDLISQRGNIGTLSAPLNVRCNNISAVAVGVISIRAFSHMNIVRMAASQKIYIAGVSLQGSNISTGLLELEVTGSVGTAKAPIGTSVQRVIIKAGKGVYLRNSGALTIVTVSGTAVEIAANRITSANSNGYSVIADSLKLTAANGIGDGKQKPLTASVNRFTGSTTSGSIYLKNSKALTISGVSAPNSVYLLIDGSLSGIGTAITTTKFVFEASGVNLEGVVKNIAGISRGNVVFVNTGKLIVGGADDDYEGITADGTIELEARSPIQISGNIIANGQVILTAGHSTAMDDSLVMDSGSLIQSKASSVRINAGDRIVIPAGSSIKAATDVILTGGFNNPNTSNTSIDVGGSINASATQISGAAATNVTITSGMGAVNIVSPANGSKMVINVRSLGGNLNIKGGTGKNSITLNMANTANGASRQINISGDNAGNEYNISMNAVGSRNTYNIQGRGTVNIETTKQDEHFDLYGDRITLNAGHGADTIFPDENIAIILRSPGGNNVFIFYDTPCRMNIETGNGNDVFKIGRIVTEQKGATRTTEGWLSRGISHETHIVTLGGNNTFTIYSVKAPLFINGGSGNDTVILKAFIEILADGKLTAYENEKIYIDGGSGENQLTVIKSGLFDNISVKDGSVKGSGFDVDYDNMNDVKVSKFQPAEDSTDSITTKQLIIYSLMQLAQSGMLYVLIALVVILAASLVYLKKRKIGVKENKEDNETTAANQS